MYPAMFRSVLAILLIFCWMLLSGFDLLADLNLPNTGQFTDPTKSPTRGKPFTALLGSDILESAAYHGTRSLNVRERSAVGRTLYTAELPQKICKLHKFLRIFII
jgi:hypothetical protein